MFGQTTVRYFAKSAKSGKRWHKCPSRLSDLGHEGEGKYAIWRNLSFVMMLGVGGLMANVYLEHQKEEPPRQPFIPYEHMRIRHKRFAWGDGQKSLFHNRRLNALPSGYEDDDE